MKIENIDIKYYSYSGFSSCSNDGIKHIKQLPYLSIVQSKVGSYKIKLDNTDEYSTGEGGFFIAPSLVTQNITHCANKEFNKFTARYVFLDVIINNTYHIDDVFDFPIVTNAEISKIFDEDFDEYEACEDVCNKMRCLYNIVKHLISISKEKNIYRNSNVYPVIEYINTNYKNKIGISDMANAIKMSESNLYAIFKKATGISPIKYLNEYRLSVACELLHNTDDSIKTIAEMVGFYDQFYFSKLFKTKYSISPQQYRKTNF